jgi:hypothetical protein
LPILRLIDGPSPVRRLADPENFTEALASHQVGGRFVHLDLAAGD